MSSPLWSNLSLDEELQGQPDASQKRLQMKKFVDKLVASGISMSIDIPQIAVVGSQSSGKSSIFEGASGVPLPRATGTCTRCPIVCRMSNKPGSWRCRVSIMRESNHDGQFSEPITFGSDILDPNDVCERIRRAQAAVLHPETEPRQFLNGYGDDWGEDGFSYDSILVDIEGPEVTDLSFVDLPGVIAQDDKNPENVERVQELVSRYIKSDSCLILLVYHCNTDLENQGAGSLAKQYDPDGRRTITVLTKPDLIQEGDELRWKEMFRTSENCFVVRQPGPKQLGMITPLQARRQETQFFQSGPWNDEYNDPFTQQRLGMDKLKNYLNIRLLEWIVGRLPQMQAEIRRHLRDTQCGLRRLPVAIDDPVRRTNDLLRTLVRRLDSAVDSYNFKIPELVGTCRRRLEEFVDLLQYHLFPRFCPFENQHKSSDTYVDELPMALPKIPGLVYNPPYGAETPKIVYLDEVVRRADEGRGRELPGNYPYGVLKEYMERAVEVWEKPTDFMLEDIFQHIILKFKDLVFTHFESFRASGAAELVWDVVNLHIESRRDHVAQILSDSIRRETTNGLIFAREEYHHFERAYREDYQSKWVSHSVKSFLRTAVRTAIDVADATGVTSHPAVKLAANATSNLVDEMPPDNVPSAIQEHAISVMAQTRAFYHIAVRRYAEGAAQIVFHDLLLDLQQGTELEHKLREAIGVSGKDALEKCRAFIEPSQETILKRNNLQRRQDMLKEVEDYLERF